MVEEAQPFLTAALARAGRVDEAVEMVKSWLPENATDEEKAKNLDRVANTFFGAKRYGEAAESFRDELRIGALPPEREAKVRYHLGICCKEVGNDDLAKQYTGEVAERYPDSDWARQARGSLYFWSN